MKRILRGMLVAAVCAMSFASVGSRSAQAQDPYWGNHWRWYNNTYRPYYHRYYYNSTTPGYYPAAPPAYNSYPGTYYGPVYTPYTPGYYGGGVQIGPLRFGWW